MSLQQQVTLRYRAEGHLRFDLPAALRVPAVAGPLVAGLESLEGVYRVDLQSRQGKLSIRYLSAVCDFAAVVRRLHALIGQWASRATEAVRPARVASLVEASAPAPMVAGSSTVAEWVRAQFEAARETWQALRILAARAFAGLSERRPRWVTEFLNDLLMLYLIKLHWHSIITLWLPNPWTYRYEWAATFYLIYLSVQAKLPKPA